MLIRDVFDTAIQERIEPVVKVSDRRPSVVLNELSNLVVTPQWEQYLRTILDAYAEAADRDDEGAIGIWISGFFGSGKSLLMKVLGTLLEGGEVEGRSIHDLFLSRVPATSRDRATLERLLTVCRRKVTTTTVGGNLHAELASADDSLALIAFRLFARERGFTHNWPLAWAVEQQIDARGLTDAFRERARKLSGVSWDELVEDSDFYYEQLCAAAAETLPNHFADGAAAVEKAIASAMQGGGITPNALVDRLRRWCADRDANGRRHKLLLQLDEVGQWISSGNANLRTMQVQALAETAAERGHGRLWIAVTAHGDVQELRQNVQQEYYAKIIKRFDLTCKLSNDDISQVVETRVLRKTQPARVALTDRFNARSGQIADLGSLENTTRIFPAPDAERLALFYPYMPWTVAVVPDVVKGIAQAAGRDEALTGSNRTMIGVVQGGIIETPGLLDSPLGKLLSLADVYDQLASDVPIETKTDINRIAATVPGASATTMRVARALFLLGQVQDYVPTTLPNVARALVDSLDTDFGALRETVRTELDRLVAAGYAKQVGDRYVFLSTQQRGFQERVRERQQELQSSTYELSQALKEYDAEEALRFDRVPLAGREIILQLEIDGRVARNPSANVKLRVSSPFQRVLDPQIGDDAAMRQRSVQDSDNVHIRLAETPNLRAMLTLALATAEVADQTIAAAQSSGADVEVARQAKANDLVSHKAEVRRLLGQSVRNSQIFFRGSIYQLAGGESPSAAVRNTLAQILPQIYQRFGEVPHRVLNEEAAVKAALNGNAANADLAALGVYHADGTLNEGHALLNAIRARLPVAEQDQGALNAETLRAELERPPFGWDGNCAKVGLALLLRGSACRLIDNSRTITDPSDPDAAQVLTKEQRFKNLRVQGVRAELSIADLQAVRGLVEAIFHVKPPLVATTLNNALGEKLSATAARIQTIRVWADTAQCSLPTEFETGATLVGELITGAAPSVRLPRFLQDGSKLLRYGELLDALEGFRNQHGAAYQKVRDFFQRIVNAEVDLDEVRRFVEDWRTIASERSVTVPARWNELFQSYQKAESSVASQLAQWQADAARRLDALEAGIPARVREAGVPEEKVETESARVRGLLGDARQRLQTHDPGLAEARAALTAVGNAELSVHQALIALRPRTEKREVRLRWAELVEPVTLTSRDDLKQVLDRLAGKIAPSLGPDAVVVVE